MLLDNTLIIYSDDIWNFARVPILFRRELEKELELVL